MAVAYMQSGQEFEMKGVAYELDRLIGNKWQYFEVKTKKADHIEIGTFNQKYTTSEIRFLGPKSTYIPDTLPYNNFERIAAALEFYPEEAQELMKARRLFIESIIKSYGDLRSQSKLVLPIREFWNQAWGKLPSPATVARWLKRYIESDKDIRSLGPCNFRKGNRQDRYPLEVRDFCSQAIDRVYLQLTRGSINKTLEEAKRLIRSENMLRPDGYKLTYPKKAYIRSLIAKIPKYDKHLRRYGQNAAMHKFRNAVNSIICNRPLERVEIDHTQLDIFLVDHLTGVPIGRPWVTMAVDVFTRAILGFQLSYDPPSHMTVARVLKMALLPKLSYSERWPSIRGSWGMFGLMENLVVDNGYEFHSNSLEFACLELGINISFCPRKQSWWKGHIERVIGTMNRAVTDGMPGRTFSSISEKAEYNPANHAAISLNTTEEMIAKWIVDIYHQTTHSELGVKPMQAWEESMRDEDIPLVTNVDKLDAVVGVVAYRKLSHIGFELNSLRYNSDELEVICRKFGPLDKATVKWNPEDLGRIQFYSPDGTVITVPVIGKYDRYATGLTYYRHQANKAYAKKYLKSEDDYEALSIAHAEIQALAEQDMKSKGKKTRVKAKRLFDENSHPVQEVKTKTPMKENLTPISTTSELPKRQKFEVSISQRKQNKGY